MINKKQKTYFEYCPRSHCSYIKPTLMFTNACIRARLEFAKNFKMTRNIVEFFEEESDYEPCS